MTNTLPTITTKQQEILKLIYRYRFLNRTQIQALLGHKDKRRIISWLKDLREKQYVDWHYNATDFIAKSQPAIYYLSLNGIRHLRGAGYPDDELRKRYKEPGRKQVFIDRCLLVADCCISLKAKSDNNLQYSCVLPADYVNPDNAYYFLNELKPHLCFIKEQGDDTTNYLLEMLDASMPRYATRKRLKDYVDFLLAGEWEDETNSPQPIVLVACPTKADLIYAKRRTRKLFEDYGIEEGEAHIRFAVLEAIKTNGVTGRVWEEL